MSEKWRKDNIELKKEGSKSRKGKRRGRSNKEKHVKGCGGGGNSKVVDG